MEAQEEMRTGGSEREVVLEQAGGMLSNAPWWLVSAGVHAVLILGATLVAMERLREIDEDHIIVTAHADSRIDADFDRPKDLFTRKGLPKDEAATDPTSALPSIFFPDAELSDHHESADGEDFHEMKGDSFDALSYIRGDGGGTKGRQVGRSAGVYDTMGVGTGGGASKRYGGRRGGRKNLVDRGGGSVATESAVMAALKWLARHQNPDGGWGAASFQNQCVGGKCAGVGERDYDAGMTGLAVLAFLGAGYSQLSRPFPDPIHPETTLRFGEVVKKGLQWLLTNQDPEGCIGGRGLKYMYNHAVAALCLSEAYGMTASQPLHEPAQRAIDFLVAAQNPGKGWRYEARSGDNDCSVTGWAVMALKSAELSELAFPKQAVFEGALNWFTEATEPTGYSRVGYNARGTGKVFIPGKNESFDHHESMSAVSVMSRIFMVKRKGDPTLSAVNLLVADLPEWKTNKVDFYYWYYATLALFQFDGPDGGLWKKWNEPMKNAIVSHQCTAKDGCQDGSWDSGQDRWGFEGGRVYGVALNALSLEVYYRYPSVFNPQSHN